MKKSIVTSLLLLAGLLASSMLSGVASASMILSQDNSLSGTTYVVDDPSAATFVNANTTTRVRWSSSPQMGTGTTAAVADATSDDYYWSIAGANLVSGGSAIPTTATFVQVDFTLTGGWEVDSKPDQIFRKTELSGGSGSSTPTDQTNLPWDNTVGATVADGSYSVIFDLTPIGDAGTVWDLLRWDFFNGNPPNDTSTPFPNAGGKTFTVDAVTYGTEVTAIPEPASVALFGLAAIGLLVRRRR